MISDLEARSFVTQGQDFALSGSGQVKPAPFPQATNTLGEMGFFGGVIGVPDFVADLLEDFRPAPATISDG